MLSPLPPSFYQRDTLRVARDLLGMRLVRLLDGVRLSGLIVETEAYRGEEDLACHARAGRTPRTAIMYGPPGRAYVYFTYGMHWMLNCVTEPEGFPAAVLIRARAGGRRAKRWWRAAARGAAGGTGPADRPGCARLSVSMGAINGADLTSTDSRLWIEPGPGAPGWAVLSGPRVGLPNVPEPWRSIPWRFRLQAE